MRSAWLQCLGEVSATAVACSRLSDVISPQQEDVSEGEGPLAVVLAPRRPFGSRAGRPHEGRGVGMRVRRIGNSRDANATR